MLPQIKSKVQHLFGNRSLSQLYLLLDHLQSYNCQTFLLCSLCLNSPRFSFRIATMIAGKRLADIGYRTFSASMMLLTMYGGYLCVMRGYRYVQRQKELKLAAENQHPEILKD